jgi:predicted  nucleic acid-binding Zn-ribbon protein
MESPLLLLIALQDIDLMILEARDPEQTGAEAELGFKMKNLDALITSRGHLAEQLDQRILGLYERMRKRYGRAVVPVESQICLGCFMTLPTKDVGQVGGSRDDRVETCENCGRILYWL